MEYKTLYNNFSVEEHPNVLQEIEDLKQEKLKLQQQVEVSQKC